MSLTTMFVDLNAYFASVEQQCRPELRGRPVAVVPVQADTTCCIAASYESKKHGVKTGMIVAEAKRRCPGLVCVPARHEIYVQMHHRVLEAVDTCVPIHAVHSIDEVSCRLARDERSPEQARQLALRVKDAIRRHAGECLRCSIGLAPNRFLAKVGTDMQKPDGLVVIEPRDLPGKLFSLDLIDLPGIGPRMLQRLNACGVHTVEELCARSEQEMYDIWGSVVGRYWWRWLRGHECAEAPTHRGSIGHQHVLGPALRQDHHARGVAIRLLHKAAARARHLGYRPGRMTLAIEVRGSGSWSASARLFGCQDTLTLIGALARIWADRPPGVPMWVDVTLHDLVNESSATLPLFPDEQRRADLAKAIDRLDRKYGRNTVYTASMHHTRTMASGGIAFSSIPDLSFPDSVQASGKPARARREKSLVETQRPEFEAECA